MLETFSEEETSQLGEWRLKIEVANHHNIFCYCRTCGAEWVDSLDDVSCNNCGSKNVQHICCWQFPDD